MKKIEVIQAKIEELLALYEARLPELRVRSRQSNYPNAGWVRSYIRSLRRSVKKVQAKSLTAAQKQTRVVALRKKLKRLKHVTLHAFAGYHSESSIPEWIRKTRKQELLPFFEIFFQKYSSLDYRTRKLISLYTSGRSIREYHRDFTELKKLESQKYSAEDRRVLLGIYASLQGSLRILKCGEI
jgi:hypothetical protein